MQKVLFIDRDGTLVIEPSEDCQLDSLEKLEFYPGVFQSLSKISKELDYDLVMVSNQDGLGTETFPEDSFWPVHNKIIQAFKNEGVEFSDVLIDKSFPEDNAPTRKPGTTMLNKYLYGNFDLKNSYVIGDRETDVHLALNLGTKAIFMGNDPNEDVDLITKSWEKIYSFLKAKPRIAKISRNTNETKITINLNLDGIGNSYIKTGIGFFNHMLEQISKHGNIDLTIHAKGDLDTGNHHTIEDVAITLGETFLKALGSKIGIERYGFLLPMDDCLAQVALDFGGRSCIVWDVEFKREMIADIPTEMFMHFFKSFSDSAKCNLNIKAEGQNEHHKIEAIFKAFAKSIKQAISNTNNFTLPSTKGSL